MPLRFRRAGILHKWWGGPPGPVFLLKNQSLATTGKPARGPAADQGVRPTI